MEGGQITIHEGRIQEIGQVRFERADFDLGDVAILPGLVNAHTHLDLSGMKGMVGPGRSFVDWLREVVEHRRGLSPEQTANDIQVGITESVRHGVTLVGDISSRGLSYPLLAEAPLRSVVFYEFLGLPPARAEKAKYQAEEWLNTHPATPTCRPGLSPHAPYSVRKSLFDGAFQLARKHKVPLATHLGETREELELLQHRKGPFVDFLSDLGVWDPEGLIHDPKELLDEGRLLANFLVVHGNYLRPHTGGDGEYSSTVIYCPRTHAAFGHNRHPFQEVLANGGRVALGTDSLASNPDLNILKEARFIRKSYPDFPGDQLLRMITLSGSEALGWDQETGSLTPGNSGDLVVLPLPPGEAKDPYDLLFDSDLTITKVMWQGSWIFENKP
jgi:cytosine/adenosine deaminase-related metal-dependent hydrolase